MGKIYTKVVDGQLPELSQFTLNVELATHDGKDICITVERKRRTRSLNQNAYYWTVVIPAIRELLEHFGNEVDDEETHSFLKEHVGKLTASVATPTGRKAITKSSATLTTAEFEEYILRIMAFAACEGVIIPSPNEHLTEVK